MTHNDLDEIYKTVNLLYSALNSLEQMNETEEIFYAKRTIDECITKLRAVYYGSTELWRDTSFD